MRSRDDAPTWTRDDLVEKMHSHAGSAEELVDRAYGPESTTHKLEILAEANAHAALAIFYQGELRDIQP